MKSIMIMNCVIILSLLFLGAENSKTFKPIILPHGLKSDGSFETNRLLAKLESQSLFSISLKNRSLKSVLNELNIKVKDEDLDKYINFSYDFEIKEMKTLEALDRILALKGAFGTFEKGTLILEFTGYRC